MKKIAVLVGSLRKGSYSKALADNLPQLAPDSLQLTLVPLGELPFFHQDWETDLPVPPAVEAFRRAIGEADGFLFVTPEYNRSVPALIKNAVDIASRPKGQNKWGGKPGMIISCSPGSIGGFGAYQILRQSLSVLNVQLLQQPELYLGQIDQLLSEDGRLISPSTADLLRRALEKFGKFAERFGE